VSSFDPELLRALAAADAALPPAAGAEFSPTRLAVLAARRTRRRLVAALAATLLVVLCVGLANLRAPAADASSAFATELAALRADLGRLQQQFQEHLTAEGQAAEDAATAAARRSRITALRCELAEARADGALALHVPPSRQETRR